MSNIVKSLTLVGLLAIAGSASAQATWTFEVNGSPINDSRMLIGLEPGAMVTVTLKQEGGLEAVQASGNSIRFQTVHDYHWQVSGGSLGASGGLNAARWTLPMDPGPCTLSVSGESEVKVGEPGAIVQPSVLTTSGATLAVQVLYPFDRNGPGMVDGYPIGIYPDEYSNRAPGPVLRRPQAYTPPPYFWRVDDSTSDMLLAPHVRLGDLSAVEPVNGTAFTAVSPLLVARLEAVSRACIANGWIEADGRLTILRGYLSPNRLQQLRQAGLSISEHTRHLYGDAVVIIVDKDGDGAMDDLNADGTIDRLDAQVLADEVVRTEQRFGAGGLGIYDTAPDGDPELPATPMVQFDCRGERARW